MSAAHDWTVCGRCEGELFRPHAARVEIEGRVVLMHPGCAAERRAREEQRAAVSDPVREGWGSEVGGPTSRLERMVDGTAWSFP